MAFSEKVKLEARRKSNFRCCICEKPFSGEVHHIKPESEGGTDTLDNAVFLCPNCHDSFGGNPEKRKQIKQKRDHWWELMGERFRQIAQASDLEHIIPIDDVSENFSQLSSKRTNLVKLSGKGVFAIYHNIFANEGFEESAKILFELLQHTQQKCPNGKRILYLDIEGHRNKKGAFDKDMFELQRYFVLGFLMPFLSEAHLPLISVKNKNPQNNTIPDEIVIFSSEKEAMKYKGNFRENEIKIYSADKEDYLN